MAVYDKSNRSFEDGRVDKRRKVTIYENARKNCTALNHAKLFHSEINYFKERFKQCIKSKRQMEERTLDIEERNFALKERIHKADCEKRRQERGKKW